MAWVQRAGRSRPLLENIVEQSRKMKDRFRLVLNMAMAIAVAAAWLSMFISGEGTLSSSGFSNLKYFTVLSNLLEGAACVFWIVSVCTSGKQDAAQKQTAVSGQEKLSQGPRAVHENTVSKRTGKAEVLKYMAACCVALTFLTVMLFLGPVFGYQSMFQGANLWFHLLIPLTAIAEQLFLRPVEFGFKENILTVIPVLIYGLGYLMNILINGVGEWPDRNDFYGFVMWGLPVGLAIFAGICVLTYVTGRLLRRPVRKQ